MPAYIHLLEIPLFGFGPFSLLCPLVTFLCFNLLAVPRSQKESPLSTPSPLFFLPVFLLIFPPPPGWSFPPTGQEKPKTLPRPSARLRRYLENLIYPVVFFYVEALETKVFSYAGQEGV